MASPETPLAAGLASLGMDPGEAASYADSKSATTAMFAWLIEAPGPNYLGTRDFGHYPEFYWTRDHTKATRFCSKAQADGVMMAVRQLSPALFAFAISLGEALPVEHGWV